MTENPWPSSDWAALLAERGIPAFLCVVLAFIGLAVEAARTAARPRAGDANSAPAGLALIASILILFIVGAFDAVLLLPAPALVAWVLLGALNGMLEPPPTPRISVALPAPFATSIATGLLCLGLTPLVRGAAQMSAMAVFVNTDNPQMLEVAGHVDPGSYRLQIRLAELAERRHDCDAVRSHAEQARALFPAAPEPVRLLATCGGIKARAASPR
jgi:hypothetical protein